jgi:hypothetical protein
VATFGQALLAQLVVQALQWAALVLRFTSQPLVVTPSQSPYGLVHMEMAHALAVQV